MLLVWLGLRLRRRQFKLNPFQQAILPFRISAITSKLMPTCHLPGNAHRQPRRVTRGTTTTGSQRAARLSSHREWPLRRAAERYVHVQLFVPSRGAKMLSSRGCSSCELFILSCAPAVEAAFSQALRPVAVAQNHCNEQQLSHASAIQPAFDRTGINISQRCDVYRPIYHPAGTDLTCHRLI